MLAVMTKRIKKKKQDIQNSGFNQKFFVTPEFHSQFVYEILQHEHIHVKFVIERWIKLRGSRLCDRRPRGGRFIDTCYIARLSLLFLDTF